ncbi:hypothetical protein MBLNU457_5192t1 [Dothideomycetes sp. NU457]
MAAVNDQTKAPEIPSDVLSRTKEAAQFIQSKVPADFSKPRIAIVCGSGLGGIADLISENERTVINYSDIPHFPEITVQGHAGQLVFGLMSEAKVPVVLLVGRAHFYEGHTMELVTFATRVCRVMGIETMIVTNAAGGLNPDYKVGDIVVLNDHLNLAGLVGFHPLRGKNVDDFGVRFPALSDAYDLGLRQKAHKAWAAMTNKNFSRSIREGVYAFVAGPTYETRAECRMLHSLGADMVGMSTVPEIIVARHSGIKILALSLVTNNAVLQPVARGDDATLQNMTPEEMEAHLSKGKATHQEVLEAGQQAANDMQTLVEKIVQGL